MAASEDGQEFEAANATATDAGRAAPAQRKQQGSVLSRRFLGSFAKEVDAERLTQLRKDNLEFRQNHERYVDRQRKKKEEMAEAYKKQKEEAATKVREERQIRLSRLQEQRDRSLALKEKSVTVSDQDDEMVDEEYRMLLEKYGDRVRAPRIPPNPWKQRSTMSTTSSVMSSRSREESLGKPCLPRGKKAPVGNASRAMGGEAGGASSSSAAAAALPAPAENKKAPASARPSPPAGHGVALPPLSAANAPRPNAASLANHANHQGQAGCHHQGISGGLGLGDLGLGDSGELVPEPERSLMPRKESLRKFQQALLKKTDVSFYKVHMKKHFRKILEVTELTFNDNTSRREQASWNLAKPLSTAEINQLSAVGVG